MSSKNTFRKKRKTKVYINGEKGKNKYGGLNKGEYALVKIESLSDRIAVEEFIEKLKNK